MIKLFRFKLAVLALLALVAGLAFPGSLDAAPVTQQPRLLVRSSELAALCAGMNRGLDVATPSTDGEREGRRDRGKIARALSPRLPGSPSHLLSFSPSPR
jgi:hypothetical protein